MPKQLTNSQAFPDLAIPAVGGGTLSLPADLAGSWGVILIYRGHWCPFCNEQLAAFASASEALSREGIKVSAFSAEDEPTARDVIEKNRIPFSMGHSADIDAVVGATGAYETRHQTRGHYLESTGFVLAPNGTVVTAVYSSRAIGRLVPADVIRMVAYLKTLA